MMLKSEKEKIRKKIKDRTIYTDKRYIEWRMKVFERDRFTCQMTGQTGGYMEAHHIFPKYKYPEKIFDVDNGITLTGYCHKWIHREKLDEGFRQKFLKLAKENKPRKKIKKVVRKVSKIKRKRTSNAKRTRRN